jgi:glutamate synthase domain-containing protein 1
MCGICGIASLDGARVDPEVLSTMNETLFHRGPDSGGTYVDGNVGLAAGTPSIPQLWAYLAAVTKTPGTPFGANPHALVL